MESKIFVGIGSNLGNRLENIQKAIEIAGNQGVVWLSHSGIWESLPWGNADQPLFLNQVSEIGFQGSPVELMKVLLETETEMGRIRGEKWAPRIIDLDLLEFRGFQIQSEYLTLPHPYLASRAFVLSPWNEIASDYHVLGFGKIYEMWDALSEEEKNSVRPVFCRD